MTLIADINVICQFHYFIILYINLQLFHAYNHFILLSKDPVIPKDFF